MKKALLLQKLRGVYYTPKPIADFLSEWAIQSTEATILEPSCGDGVFLESAINALLKLGAKKKQIKDGIHGIEFNTEEAEKAKERIKKMGIGISPNQVHTGDFFFYCKEHLTDKISYDAVIGNPPFIRYQSFLEEHRSIAFALMKRAGLNPNRLTNAWIPFLVVSTMLLKEKGRLAMVIPAELFQVNYAAETRRFLSDVYSKITIITFKKLVFDAVQQEVVLLLAERNGNGRHGIKAVEINDVEDLKKLHDDYISKIEMKSMDHSTEKWTLYFLDTDEIELLRALKKNPALPIAAEFIDVDVGVVTGENEFFVLSQNQVKENELGNHVDPLVGRSNSLRGLIFNKSDWSELVGIQRPAFLLRIPDKPIDDLPLHLVQYIKKGEEREYHVGYKCRIRKHWYAVPSVWIPDAFMLRQVHGYPKLIYNKANATCTDTLHRVRFINGVDGKVITAAFVNSLTLAFAEVTGRSYGGGVLTFEPSEAERLPLPANFAKGLDFFEIDKLLRGKNNIEAVLDITDEVILRKGLQLKNKEIKMLRGIWKKLSQRRMNRK